MECNNLLRIVIKDYIKPEFFSRVKENTEEGKMKYLKEMGFEANPKGGYIFYCNTFARFFMRYTDVVLLPNEEELALYNQKKGVYELKTPDGKETVFAQWLKESGRDAGEEHRN